MCGLIGGNIFSSLESVENGIQAMYHRGTDKNVLFTFSNGMYLAHNRLSIQDLSDTATQPMESDCGRYYIVFNGELWKSTFKKFDKKLRAKYPFKTTKSDTELLLYFLIEYQEKLDTMLREVEGMFAFAFYDRKYETLYLARDFIGRIPIYYYFDGEKIGFSSEVKGLTQAVADLKFFRAKRNSPKEEKEQEKIELLSPGSLLTYRKSNNVFFDEYEIKKKIWFSYKEDKKSSDYLYINSDEDLLKVTGGQDLGLDHYAKGFRDLLWKAVEDEMIADVPVCTILSGGIDSTIITYILSKLNPNIEAFVVHMGEESNGKDDLHYARIAAKQIGIKLNEVHISKEMVESALEERVWACEGNDWRQVSCSVAQLYLAKEIRKKGFKVVFGGEGADEIFASYNDVKRWSWKIPLDYHRKRVNLINSLHAGNLIRCNKVLMYGGELELRTPFTNRALVTYGLTLPVRYRSDRDGKGNKMKFLLRKAFEKEIPNEDLIWRPKITMQIGCHTDYLKEERWQEHIKAQFRKVFQEKEIPKHFLEDQFRDFSDSINLEVVEKV